MERCGVPYSCCAAPNDVNVEYINTMCGYRVQELSENAAKEKIFTVGCMQEVMGLAQQNLYIVGGVAIGLGLLQLFGIFLSRILATQIANQRALWI